MRDLIAPLFRGAVKLMYPKSGCILLGNITKKDIKHLTKGQPVIYAPAHRGVFDAPRFIAHSVPHSYIVSGDEKSFYCTINEYLLELNGILHFDRNDSNDRRLMVDRVSKILKSNHSVLLAPEGTPNLYARKMLKLYPGIIKIALNTGAIILPLGNEIHIQRDNKIGQIVGDVNYMMFEDYYNGQELFRPSDDIELAMLHANLKDFGFTDVVEGKTMERFISDGNFIIGDVHLDMEEKLHEFLSLHPKLKGSDNGRTKEYLMRCAVLGEYNKKLNNSLNTLEERMCVLSDKICIEIDKRHPITLEERERNSREYVDYCLDFLENVAKKGRRNAYDEIDKFVNKTTDENIIESTTKKVLKGLELLRS
jgi:hypothetical protein